jgi:NAD(P)-dependent dehydrogenase (short-subunit alcohol dehydrogenase family)
MGVSLARDLAPRKIAVALLHPGYVRTDMTAKNGNVDPDEAARQLVDRFEQLSMETTASFWHANGEVLPW